MNKNINSLLAILILFSLKLAPLYALDNVIQSQPALYYAIPDKVKKLEEPTLINLENIDSPYFIVKAKLNGKGPYLFMIDTGTPITMLTRKVAQELNLQSPTKKNFAGNSTYQTVDHYKINELTLGDAILYDYDIGVFEEPNLISNFIKIHKFNIDGILTIGAFYHYLLALDYPNKRISLVSKELDSSDKSTIPFAPIQKVPAIAVVFKDDNNHKVEINCVIDTGYVGQFTFPANITTIPFKLLEENVVKANTGFKEYVVHNDKIEAKAYFSNMIVQDPYILHGEGMYGTSGNTLGLMGLYVIQQFRISIDQKNRLLKIEHSGMPAHP